MNHSGLISWLAADPLATDCYYYDNVDYDVEINDATFGSPGSVQTGAKVYLKYPLSATKVSVTGWSYDVSDSSKTFLKKD